MSSARSVACVVGVSVALVTGLVWRFTKIPNELHAQSVQLMGAIALTYLPVTFDDFGAHVLDNFWKFLFHGEHALEDYAFCYTVVRVLAALDLPIIPRYIYLAEVLLNIACVAIVYALARRMFSPAVAAVAALFLWLNWTFIAYTRVMYNWSLPVAVTVVVLYLAHVHYTTRTWTATVLFAIALTCAMGTHFLFLSPLLIGLYAALAASGREERPWQPWQFIVIAAPALAMVAFQLYLYVRIGPSGLGMFARLLSKTYSPLEVDASKLREVGSNAWAMFNDVFQDPWLAAIFIAALLVHATRLGSRALRRRGPVLTVADFVWLWLVFALAAGAYTQREAYIIVASAAILVGVYCVQWIQLLGGRPALVTLPLAPLFAVYLWHSATRYRNYEPEPEKPYKAVGYFVRTEGRPFARVFNVDENIADTLQCQYYYGKNYQTYDKPERTSKYFPYRPELKKLIYTSFELPLEALDRAGRVGRIDFYVFYESGEESRPRDVEILRRNGFVPVARIFDQGRKRAAIYGRPELGYRGLDMRTANRLWEQQIARLPTLYEHHRIGVADFWGHWQISANDVE